MEIKIVDFEEKYLNDALEILYQSNSIHCKNEPSYFKINSPDDCRPYLTAILNNSTMFGFIALDEYSKIAGILFAGLEHKLDNAYVFTDYYKIFDIAVSEKFRGRGIGAMLNEAIVKKAQHNHIGNIELDVYMFNIQAQKFYEKLGYKDLCKTLCLYV